MAAPARFCAGSVEIDVRDNMDLRLDKLEKSTQTGLLREGEFPPTGRRRKLEIEALTPAPPTWARALPVSVAQRKVSVTAPRPARFEAHGKRVVVRKETRARPSLGPPVIRAHPRAALLSVIWPEDDKAEAVSKPRSRQPSSRARERRGDAWRLTDFSGARAVTEAQDPRPCEPRMSRATEDLDKILRPAPRRPSLQTSVTSCEGMTASSLARDCRPSAAGWP